MKGSFWALAALVMCILIVCIGACYLRLAAPGKLLSIAEKYNGGVDDNIPFQRIWMNQEMSAADRNLFMANLSRVSGLKEVSIAANSPDAKWLKASVNLSEMRTISVNGAANASSLDDFLALIGAAPKLTRMAIYNTSLSRADLDLLRRNCTQRGVEVFTYP